MLGHHFTIALGGGALPTLVVSMIIFLGSPPDDEHGDRPWDVEIDGRELRIYHSNMNTKREQSAIDGSDNYFDVPPTPGTILLFDSAVVPHEVMETHRKRRSVVGWFGVEC